jgi:hypothetical protein
MKVYVDLISRSVLLRVRETEVIEEIKTHILCSITSFPNILSFMK